MSETEPVPLPIKTPIQVIIEKKNRIIKAAQEYSGLFWEIKLAEAECKRLEEAHLEAVKKFQRLRGEAILAERELKAAACDETVENLESELRSASLD